MLFGRLGKVLTTKAMRFQRVGSRSNRDLCRSSFFCGATVIVEGPAELDLKSPLLAKVHHGRLRAQVPPAARGFSLEVDELKVVDLGTEFGLSVEGKETTVQVFDGEVELQEPRLRKRRLQTGEALRRGQDGTYSQSNVAPHHFLDIASLESREIDEQRRRALRWKQWSDQLRRDKRLIAYYAIRFRRKLATSVAQQPRSREPRAGRCDRRCATGQWSLVVEGRFGIQATWRPCSRAHSRRIQFAHVCLLGKDR